MNNLPTEMIGEIAQWLQIVDIKTARLVWRNIAKNQVYYYAKYIRSLMRSNNITHQALKKIYNDSPTIQALYAKTGHSKIEYFDLYDRKIHFIGGLDINCKQANIISKMKRIEFFNGNYAIKYIKSKIICDDKRGSRYYEPLGIYTKYSIYFEEEIYDHCIQILHDFDHIDAKKIYCQ